ncbi:MAG: ThiF family adenylyltransferase [Pirellulales bacterium]|nr:ThiF family adenylyltransferase [Pirellulales bacterium]
MSDFERPYELRLLPRVWQQDLLRLARGTRRGSALLEPNDWAGARELVCHRLTDAQRAADFAPRDDFLVIELADSVPAHAAERLLVNTQPLPTQCAVGVVLGTGPAAGQWNAAVDVGRRLAPLDRITLVGPSMRSIQLKDRPALLDASTATRWSRTIGALGEDVFHRVRNSTVAVVGVGRNGSAAAWTLAMLGARRILLIDEDIDQLHNLDATVGAPLSGLGQPKVTNRASQLIQLRPDDLVIEPLRASIRHRVVMERLRGVDLLVTCVDSDVARLAAARLVNKPWLAKVHLDIGSGIFRDAGGERRMGADLRLCVPGECCIACLGGLRQPDLAEDELSAPIGALPRQRPPRWDEDRAGSCITISQVSVNLGIQLWLDFLAGRVTESRWQRLEWSASGELSVTSQVLPGGVICPVCRGA